MDEPSPLDLAHERMSLNETDDVARLAFYERVADTEFLMLLNADSDGEAVDPTLITSDGMQFALLFDRVERLAEFAGEIVPYVALSGRACVSMLAGQNIGMGINLGVATSNTLLPPDAIDWLNDILSRQISEDTGQPVSVGRPSAISQDLLGSLNTKLALASGMAKCAYLVNATYGDGTTRLLLGIIDSVGGSETAIVNAVSEALVFSGEDEGAIDVAFFKGSDGLSAHLAKHGLRFDIPEPDLAPNQPSAPGMDPDKPPRLR